jgi:hypothetical protein
MKMREATNLLLTLILLSASALPGRAQESQPTPGLRVESEQLHVGEVAAGSSVEGVFVFHNDGDQPIHILRAKPT